MTSYKNVARLYRLQIRDGPNLVMFCCRHRTITELQPKVLYQTKQESLANAKVSARQQCVYEDH